LIKVNRTGKCCRKLHKSLITLREQHQTNRYPGYVADLVVIESRQTRHIRHLIPWNLTIKLSRTWSLKAAFCHSNFSQHCWCVSTEKFWLMPTWPLWRLLSTAKIWCAVCQSTIRCRGTNRKKGNFGRYHATFLI